MTTHLEQEIAGLKDKLLTMAGRSEGAVTKAIQSVLERDDKLARAVIAEDAIVDQLEIEIDEHVILLLAKAMLATDLRLMAVTMKICHELERVADEATTIARRSLDLGGEPPLELRIDIARLAQLALGQLKEALDAFVNRQPGKARAIIPRDKELDALNKQFQRDLTGYMVQRPDTISRCLNFMVISKSLERIGDHATGVAEEVVYLYEAEDIRHLERSQT